MYKLIYKYLKFRGRHFRMSTSGSSLSDRTTLSLCLFDCLTHNTSGDTSIFSSEAAISKCSLPVSLYLIVQHCHYVYFIAGHRKQRYSRWNFVAIMYTSRDIRYCLSTSGQRLPPLCSNIHRRRTVSPLVFPCCLTPKTWV